MQVCHREGNIASRGVIRKCGFTYEGTLRDYFFTEGKYIDRLYYSMLESEFRAGGNVSSTGARRSAEGWRGKAEVDNGRSE